MWPLWVRAPVQQAKQRMRTEKKAAGSRFSGFFSGIWDVPYSLRTFKMEVDTVGWSGVVCLY